MFGKLLPCPHRKDEANQTTAQQLRQELGPLCSMTVETFEPEGHAITTEQKNSLRMAIESVRRFINEPRGWLLMQGGYGCGKTHLAAAIANGCLDKGVPVLFVNAPDLLDYLRGAYNPNVEETYDERFNEVCNTPILILDDLGTQNATPWAEEKLYQILNSRYVSKRPTVITTNLDLEDIDPRLSSRLSDLDLVRKIIIRAPDFRRSMISQSQNSLSALHQYDDKTFDSFRLRKLELTQDEQHNLKEALRIATDFANDPKDWLVFAGTYGIGKTHLAAAIANFRVEHGYPAMFVVVPDLLDYLRAAFSPDSRSPLSQRFEEVRNSPLLILDDLGTESATPWAKEKLYQIINYRYAGRLPTVITTSLSLADFDPRIRVRILDDSRCLIFPIIVPNYRGGADVRAPQTPIKSYSSRRKPPR